MNPLNIQQFYTDLGPLKTLTNYWYPENKSGAYQARHRLGNSIDDQNKRLRNSTLEHLREIPDQKYYISITGNVASLNQHMVITIEDIERMKEFLKTLS